MANRQTIGLIAVISGIVLAAAVGTRSAVSWLSRSSSDSSSDDSAAIQPNRTTGDELPTFDQIESDRAQNNRSEDRRSDNSTVSQANNAASVQTLPALEEAGSYIQRQQRVELDPVIAATPVEVIPVVDSDPVAARPDTVNPQQPTADDIPSFTRPDTTPSPSAPISSTQPTRTNTTPSTAPTANDPVPALW